MHCLFYQTPEESSLCGFGRLLMGPRDEVRGGGGGKGRIGPGVSRR